MDPNIAAGWQELRDAVPRRVADGRDAGGLVMAWDDDRNFQFSNIMNAMASHSSPAPAADVASGTTEDSATSVGRGLSTE